MIPVLLKLGPLTIYSYGLMMALSFLAADLVIAAECRRRGITPDYATSVVVWGAVAGIVGARVYDVIDNFPFYMRDPWSMVFSGSGFVWYGGLIGGILTIYLVARHYRVAFLVTADMCAPALAVGQALGRVGCQLSGDGDWGLPSKLPWAMAYPHAIIGWNANTVLKLDSHDNLVSGFYPGVRVHPAPIYEAILYVGVFVFLWSIRKRNRVAGRLFFLYLVTAGAARFLVEFVRINPRVLWGLSEAQLIAIVMMVTGTAAYLYTSSRAANGQPIAAKPARKAFGA
jgi:phosphatidylglycerol---prolipoprotein diacylglyceryl transferase